MLGGFLRTTKLYKKTCRCKVEVLLIHLNPLMLLEISFNLGLIKILKQPCFFNNSKEKPRRSKRVEGNYRKQQPKRKNDLLKKNQQKLPLTIPYILLIVGSSGG